MEQVKAKGMGSRGRRIIKEVLEKELHSLLHDVTYRIGVLQDERRANEGLPHRLTSGMLNFATHQLDGFTLTDNSPVAGSVAWSDCNIVYKGTSYIITNGNTADKYIYWVLATTPTTFKTSASKPALGVDDVLVAINDGGTAQIAIGTGRMTHGSAILNATVDSGEIKNGAVLADKIAALAITEGKIGSGAVTVNKIGALAVAEGKIAASAVTVDKIGSNAVTEAKINTGAVTEGKIGTSAVTEGKIGAGAVTTAKIGDLQVAEGKIAASAVTSGKIANNAVISDKINAGAVTTAKVGDLQITGAKLGAGAVAEDKLNVAFHFLF